MVRARGAVIHGVGEKWRVEDLRVGEPAEGEVLVKVMATGLCHSDDHVVRGDIGAQFPQVGGHEGAGIVEQVGPGVTRVRPGDRVATLFVPVCGTCRYCATGRSYLCDSAAATRSGLAADGSARFFLEDGREVTATSRLGTFANYLVCHETQLAVVPEGTDFVAACLVSCGVLTGWGAAVNAGNVRPGDTVLVLGAGGVGMNAVQGARHAGADHVVVVDLSEFARSQAPTFGATDVFSSLEEAGERIAELTDGRGADVSVITVGRVNGDIIGQAFDLTGKDGTCVVASLGSTDKHIAVNPRSFSNLTKTMTGSLLGNCNPVADVPRLLRMYSAGRLKLDELVTRTYSLDQINEAYDDLHAGVNIRGVILHEH
ncbi:Zn-dependent alcohol dehydrogenase [Thermobifida cellulosilytica]|uniref:Alcohol dehydrogenase n=1 Tax=Thermobifida cellulosilytica TB100 TaxID=665004 RepID=A0A147KLF8_THECS|nr:Zn-dependent alcohol dehydrogenase [Thermobifida cellulosilytica]KUP98142.1 alcohol dehydrogenase [Thermobifida cellulosilytica TB100]